MRIFLFAVWILWSVPSFCQTTWFDLIAADKTYGEIISDCENLFSSIGKGKGSGFKQYMRWRYKMDARASADQKIKNYSAMNIAAYEAAKRSSAPSRATTGDWENIGPFDYTSNSSWGSGGMGRVNCLTFHPSVPWIWWVGTAAGGMWRTMDGGETWEPLTDGFPSIGISSILVHPNHPDTMYILTGDGDGVSTSSIGILKTMDGGMTWKPTGFQFSPSQYRFGFKLLLNPNNPETFLVAMLHKGLYRTVNGGETFTQEIGNDTTVWDIEYMPTDPLRVYAATNKGFMRSLDGGQTWFVDGDAEFPTTYERMAIAISPSAPNNVYVVFGGDTYINGTYRGCFKSTNQGVDFTMQSNTPNILGWAMNGDDDEDQAGYDLSIIVDSGNDEEVYVGGVNIWKSDDSGVNWNRVSWQRRDNEPEIAYAHADHHNLYYRHPFLYSCNDGGLYSSIDPGDTWTEHSAGLAIGQFYQIDMLNESYMGGMQDNGTMEGSTTNPQSTQLAGGDGFGCAWHTGDNSIQYISSQDAIARRQFGSNITIWDELNGFWHNEIEMHTTDPNYFFLAKNTELYRAHQDGAIWNFVWEDLNIDAQLDDNVRAFTQSPSNPNVMYACSQSGIVKTENLSAAIPTWSQLPDPTPELQYSDIEIDPGNPDRIWVTRDGYIDGLKVFYSDDGGDTWENISGSIQNVPIRCLAYASGTYSGVYVGTEIGVYYRGDDMSDWVSFSNLFPNTIVSDIEIRDGFIYAGTYGRGIWRSPEYSTCPVNLTLTPGNDPSSPYYTGTQSYYASNSIVSTRIIPGNIGNTIYYSAGFKTDLLLGFKAEAGSFVDIKSDGCPD